MTINHKLQMFHICLCHACDINITMIKFHSIFDNIYSSNGSSFRLVTLEHTPQHCPCQVEQSSPCLLQLHCLMPHPILQLHNNLKEFRWGCLLIRKDWKAFSTKFIPSPLLKLQMFSPVTYSLVHL